MEYKHKCDKCGYNFNEEAQSLGLLGEKKVCKSCLGKKQHSVLVNHSFTDDFTGERHKQQSTIEMMNCGRCDGTGIEPEFIPEKEVESQQNIVRESPSEDNLVEKLIEKREKRFIQLQTYPKSEIHKAMRNEIGIFIDDLKHLSSK